MPTNPEQATPEMRGERLATLRRLNRLTQTELSKALGVTQSFVSHIERGERPLPVDVAVKAHELYQVPMTFFSVNEALTPLGAATFRKSSASLVRDQDYAHALLREASNAFKVACERTGFQEATLPSSGDPEVAAVQVREHLGLAPGEAVPNMTRLIERLGVAVITSMDPTRSLDAAHDSISAGSQRNPHPVIAGTRSTSGDRMRLSLGHELGHVIFDPDRSGPILSSKSMEERRAFRFAAALLIPEEVARERIEATLTLNGYVRVKAEFGISVGALIYRARTLGIIDERRYRSLNIQRNSAGWRTSEPVDVPNERGMLFGQAIRAAFGSIAAASHELGINPDYLNLWSEDSAEAPQTTDNVVEFRRRS